MAKPLVMYMAAHDPEGEMPFLPITGSMVLSKLKAMKELKKVRWEYPDAYLAKVTYTKYQAAARKKEQ